MPEFNAPLTDMRFVLNEVFAAPALWARLPALADTLDWQTAEAMKKARNGTKGKCARPSASRRPFRPMPKAVG